MADSADDPLPGRHGGELLSQRFRSREEQRRAYVTGEWGNPLTTIPAGGRILSALQLPWFTLMPPRGYGVLTTSGRKTGKKRRKCVRAIRRGDTFYLVSLRGPYGAWMGNIHANPRVSLRIKGGTLEGLAREINDSPEFDQAKQVYCGTLNPFDRMSYRMHRRGRPTAERIRALHEHWFTVGTPVVIELSENGPGSD
jgi:deazaflavin-dependent oxidoreductase (nitroreductase family)